MPTIYSAYGPLSPQGQYWLNQTPEALIDWHNSYAPSQYFYDQVIITGNDEHPAFTRIYFNDSVEIYNFACYNSITDEYSLPATYWYRPAMADPADYHYTPRQYKYAEASWDPTLNQYRIASYYTAEWLTSQYRTDLSNRSADSEVVITYATGVVLFNSEEPQVADQVYAEFLTDQIGMRFGVFPGERSLTHMPVEGEEIKYWFTKDFNMGLNFRARSKTGEDPETGLPFYEWKDFTIPADEVFEDKLDYVYPRTTFVRSETTMEPSPGWPPMVETTVNYFAVEPGRFETSAMRGIACLAANSADPINAEDLPDIQFNDTLPYQNQYRSTNDLTIEQLAHYVWDNIDSTVPADDFFTEYTLIFADEDAQTYVEYLDFSSYKGTPIAGGGGGGGGGGTGGDNYNSNNYDININPSDTTNTRTEQPSLSNIGTFNRTWFLNASQVADLCNMINTTDDSVMTAILKGLEMWGGSPINAILDLRLYPFDVGYLNGNRSATGTIWLGRYNTGISANYLNGAPIAEINLGELQVRPKYKNFLDFEPYTKLTLYIPYIGTTELSATLFYDCKIDVKMIVDYSTGVCTAIIYRTEPTYKGGKRTAVKMLQGTIGLNVAVSGDNAAQYASDVMNAGFKAAGSLLGLNSVKDSNAISSLVGFGKDLADLGKTLNETTFESSGSNSATGNTYMPQYCYLITQHSIPAVEFTPIPSSKLTATIYGLTMGWATARTLTPLDLNPDGINYGSPIDISDVAREAQRFGEAAPTDAELNEIKSLLEGGFYRGYTL